MSLTTWYHSLLIWIEQKLTSPHWLWIVTLWCIALSLFLAFPPYFLLARHLAGTGILDAWRFIDIQAHDILHPTHLEVYIRRENMVFRWFLPFLSYITGHNIILILVLQALCGVFLLYFTARLFYQFSGSKVQTALFSLALANVYAGSVAFVDVQGYGDGFACFFLMVCLVTRQPLVLFSCLFASFLVDERSLMASGLVGLWWIVREHTTLTGEKDNPGQIVTALLRSPAWVIVLCWIVYFGGRYYVKSHYFADHTYSTMGTPVLLASAHRAGLGNSLWTAFEGMWLLIGSAGLVLVASRRYYLLSLITVGFLVVITMGIYVHDIDRALSYGFPLFFIAGLLLVKSLPVREVTLLLFLTALLCMFHPLLMTMGYDRIIWIEPLPVKAAMLLDRILGWGYFD